MTIFNPRRKRVNYWRERHPEENRIYEGYVEISPIGFGYLWAIQSYPNKFHVFNRDLTYIDRGFTFTRISADRKIDSWLMDHPELHGKNHWR